MGYLVKDSTLVAAVFWLRWYFNSALNYAIVIGFAVARHYAVIARLRLWQIVWLYLSINLKNTPINLTE